MKRRLLPAFLVLLTATAYGQLHKGSFLVGGSVSLQSIAAEQTFGNTHNISFQLQPAVGYFLLNKLATGLRAGYLSSKYKNADDEVWTHKNYSLAPFARYYFMPQGSKVNVLLDASYQFSKAKSVVNSSVTITRKGYALAAGPVVFLNPGAALEFTVGYRFAAQGYYKKERTVESAIGLQIHLGKRRTG